MKVAIDVLESFSNISGMDLNTKKSAITVLAKNAKGSRTARSVMMKYKYLGADARRLRLRVRDDPIACGRPLSRSDRPFTKCRSIRS